MTAPSPGRFNSRQRRSLLGALVALVVLGVAGIFTAVLSGVWGADGDDPRGAGRNSGRTAGPVDRGGALAPHWVGTWSAAPVGPEPDTYLRGHSGRTFRNVVRAGIGGDQVRITLSNLYGEQPLRIASATVALAAGATTPAAERGSLAPLTFGGAATVTVPPGDEVTSDAVGLRVPADTDLLVSTYAPESAEPGGPVTYHPGSRQTSYAADGDRTHDESGDPYDARTTAWRHLVAVDVRTDRTAGAIVAFGDSITDGAMSSVDENRRWTDVLADRLRKGGADEQSTADTGTDITTGTGPGTGGGTGGGAGKGGTATPRLSVLNAGISGNRLLREGVGPSGLDRFDRDVLSRAGVRVVVIELGINDIGRTARPAEPEKIVAGLRELTERARARGLLVVGATLTPYGGHKSYSAEGESVRRAVNARIRAGEVFDAVVDFDRILRDPEAPDRLRAEYDSGDHLHPGDAGYRAMGRGFDLKLLKS
ncbi:GDSL-type esterase/lipase family protein [Streptomyces sp. NPDC101132]|uniref:SGNH/GDSL hydrolase family protein n=1 Tax=Streptomyces sp. NPDC101132 TaxID=3366110 RepID=UPI0037FB004D